LHKSEHCIETTLSSDTTILTSELTTLGDDDACSCFVRLPLLCMQNGGDAACRYAGMGRPSAQGRARMDILRGHAHKLACDLTPKIVIYFEFLVQIGKPAISTRSCLLARGTVITNKFVKTIFAKLTSRKLPLFRFQEKKIAR
jgi:hypothetical protein